MKFIGLLFLFITGLTATASADFSETLDRSNFYAFQKSDIGESTISGWIKFVTVQKADKLTLYYFNSNKWLFHADFVKSNLSEYKDLSREQINDIGLDEKKPELNFGSLVYLSKPELGPVLQILTKNDVSPDYFLPFRKKVRESVKDFELQQLRQFPSPSQRAFFETNKDEFQRLGIALYFQKLEKDFQTYHSTWSVGRLKVVEKTESEDLARNVTKDTILLVNQLPHELPPLRGVIVAEPSSPLSHIALMATTYNYPFAYHKEAFSRWKDWDGRQVYFRAGPFGVEVFPVSESTYDRLNPYKEIPQGLADVKVDYGPTALQPIAKIYSGDVPMYGAKAVNFAKLVRMFRYSRHKDAFAIPVGFVKQVLDKTLHEGVSVTEYVQTRLQSISDRPLIEAYPVLKEIRKSIEKAKMSPEVAIQLKSELDRLFPGQKVRFRSSSPFEDNEAFNGAGLYTSKGIKPDHSLKEIKKDFLKVVASLYNDRAYAARKSFGFPEKVASMGILVHPAYVGELARGVAVMKQSQFGKIEATVSGFWGDKNQVVDAPLGVLPEVADLREFFGRLNVDIVQNTTELPAGRFVLQQQQYRQLYKQMERVFKSTGREDIELDFEWKLVDVEGSTPLIELKQFRPVPKKDRFPKPDQNIFVVDSVTELKTRFYEAADVIHELKNQQRVRIEGELIDFNKESQPQISKIFYTDTGGKQTVLTGEDLKFEFTEGFWRVDLKLGDGSQLLIKKPWNNNNVPNVRPSSELNFEIWNSQFQRNISLNAEGIESVLGSGPNNQKITEAFSDDDVEMIWTGVTRMFGYDKTMHLKMTSLKLNISGKTVQINGSRAVMYSPAHHNFYWEYGVDLQKASQNLAAEEQVALKDYLSTMTDQPVKYFVVSYPRHEDIDEGDDRFNLGQKFSVLRLHNEAGEELFKKIISRQQR